MFLEYLAENKLEYLIAPPKEKKFLPKNSLNVYLKIRDAMKAQHKIYVEPDCDPDGFFSALAWKYTFDKLGYSRYEMGVLTERSHHVKFSKILEKLECDYRTIILVDSSTSDTKLIQSICNHTFSDGTHPELIIIDHHQTEYSWEHYPENCTLVNPKLEPKRLPYYSVSAGLVNAIVCDYVLNREGYTNNEELYVYGYITMYSDSCAVNNPYIASIMHKFMNTSQNIPEVAEVFWDQYSIMNRNFVSFKMIPLMNAAMRMNRFDLIDKLFFHPETMGSYANMVQQLADVRKQGLAIVDMLLKSAMILNESPVIVIAVIPQNLDPVCYNFMGLLATKLASQHNKIALCLYKDEERNVYVGSARDHLNRDLLSEFSTFFEKSAGHTSAFGVTIKEDKLEIIPDIIAQTTLKEAEKIKIFDYTDLKSDKELRYMAIYNEMAIIGLPKAAVRINISGDFQINTKGARCTAVAKALHVTSFSGEIERYSTVICTPSFNGNRIECVVNK